MRKYMACLIAVLAIFGTTSVAYATFQQNKADTFQKSSTEYF